MLDNHENIWKLYWGPTPPGHSSHSWFYTILVAFLWIVLLVHVSFKSCPTPSLVQMSHDQQKSLKLDPMIGWMNSWSSCELDSIFKSLISCRAHIKLTNNRTVSQLFSHMICLSSAYLESHQATLRLFTCGSAPFNWIINVRLGDVSYSVTPVPHPVCDTKQVGTQDLSLNEPSTLSHPVLEQ